MELTARAKSTVAAVMDALIAGDPSPSSLGLADRFQSEVFDNLGSDKERRDLAQLLRLMSSGAGGIVLYGMPSAFVNLQPEDRERALSRMARSPVALVRFGFKSLKSIIGLLYGNPPRGHEGSWQPWVAMGYPGPDQAAPVPPSNVEVTVPDGPATWECDVVIVGSGAGGGVAAAVLAAAGLDVVVLEKGGDNREADFPRRENEALARLYQAAGTAATSDGGVTLLAGATLGGGTTVNYTTSFATPDDVRAEWDRVSGLAGVFTGEDYAESGRAVEQGFRVNLDHGEPPGRERPLEEGLRRLGWHVAEQPRNVVGCQPESCGSCGMGCRLGAKMSTLRTWLVAASSHGARVVTDAAVDRVLVHRGVARGVIARAGEHSLEVRARAVVLAAGALNTPAILLRSGIGFGQVGANLRLHPATAVWARFSDPVDPWTGMMQTRYSDQFADLDGEGYGYRIETAPVHPTFNGMFLGWGGGEEFARDLNDLPHLTPFGILLRDRAAGKVKAHSSGATSWQYRMTGVDRKHILTGVEKNAEVAAAAGAEEVIASTLVPIRWRPALGGSAAEFAAEVGRYGIGANRMVYVSFHQMGSARMGADKRMSVVDGDNQVHGVDGLYVMDGSAFPTASGVNPMISIATIAHRAARGLAARLG